MKLEVDCGRKGTIPLTLKCCASGGYVPSKKLPLPTLVSIMSLYFALIFCVGSNLMILQELIGQFSSVPSL